MTRIVALVALASGLLAATAAFAADRTVTLAVQNMDCADCPFIVKKSLEAVPGVLRAIVSFENKTATVTYDDAKADVSRLTKATTEAGYPSAPTS
jgi:periplasmic mercuric ion binding protein